MEQTVEKVVSRYGFNKSFTLNGKIDTQSMTSELSDDGILIVTGEIFDEKNMRMKSNTEVETGIVDFQRRFSSNEYQSLGIARTRPYYNYDVFLDISKCKNFYAGDTYGDLHWCLTKSFSKILKNFGVETTSDSFAHYRNIRQSNYSEETQAFGVSQRGNRYQVIFNIFWILYK